MKTILTDKTYDILKWVALVLLPALAVLYGALAKVWNFPYPSEIVYTITAIDTFLGAVLGISNINYNNKKVDE